MAVVVVTIPFSLESVTVGADATEFGDSEFESSSTALALDMVEDVSSGVVVINSNTSVDAAVVSYDGGVILVVVVVVDGPILLPP